MTAYATYIKRLFDLTSGAVLMAATAPLHIVSAAAVLVTSGPPVYYRAKRAGIAGNEFTLFKFRTMYTDTEARFGAFPPGDAVTPVGKVLRRTSLDELPQLANVLRGEMSLVGPRPALPSHVDRYTEAQRQRLTVRPGITGLAQVRYRNSAPWTKRIDADIEYINNLTFFQDVSLLFRTIYSVFSGAGQVVGQSAADVDDLTCAELNRDTAI